MKIKIIELYAIMGKEEQEEVTVQVKVNDNITEKELLKMAENFAKIIEYGCRDLEDNNIFSVTIESQN